MVSKTDELDVQQLAALLPEKNEIIVFSSFLSLLSHLLLLVGVSFIFSLANIDTNMKLLLAQEKAQKEPLRVEYKAVVAQQSSGEHTENIRSRTLYKPLFASLEFLPQMQFIHSIAGQGQDSSSFLSSQHRRDYIFSANQHQKVAESGFSGTTSSSELISNARDELQAEIANTESALGALQEQQAKRPRIKRYTSIAAKASFEAEYIHQWVTKIETIGNLNYPQNAIAKSITGNLRLLVALDAKGRVVNLRLLESSGYSVLDDAAKHIVRLAEPFQPFPTRLQSQADIIEIVRTWYFFSDGQKIVFQ